MFVLIDGDGGVVFNTDESDSSSMINFMSSDKRIKFDLNFPPTPNNM